MDRDDIYAGSPSQVSVEPVNMIILLDSVVCMNFQKILVGIL